MFSEKKGFKAQVANNLIGLMIIIIIAVGVVIPVVQQMSTDANLTGVTKTIVDLLPMLIAVLIIIIITKFY